jgi:hypothetical protein
LGKYFWVRLYILHSLFPLSAFGFRLSSFRFSRFPVFSGFLVPVPVSAFRIPVSLSASLLSVLLSF